ncbi:MULTISPECIES: hypothetical protein [Acidobacterium]|uniref:Uncharacterized protein n=1 Tax=Acidobacterium capsulatum (strain ATCC 51196 / DSM 11244 / BCRC 80197 / JCM 7670 / NBRC 15755 / NCIMB 13165 / 161) TaxID=240015 RepID=C1F8Y5_ACIC5|nr:MULTISPECIES: hypothetical protein [Acidobacterium]ACO34554.1 hypothetical protein ACP_2047 [Acidobacterium capsulatum ATCC 51196]HCT59907.1 hypothetical protein [Acidobacterium sp.]
MSHLNANTSPRHPEAPEDLVNALHDLHSARTAELVQRTRRNVMETAHRMQSARSEGRRRMGFVLLIFGLFVLLLTPALWAFCEEIFGANSVSDATSLAVVAFLMLFSTVLAFALGQSRERQSSRRGYF